MPNLKSEIAQQRPFSSPAEEALLNLLRTTDCLQRAMQRATRRWGITATQYNVLRILRGAQPEGLACSAIGARMITAEPDITRLLARLRALRYIRQQREKKDKRVLLTQISESGLALLEEMDETVARFPMELLGHLNKSELGKLIWLLEKARLRCGDAATAVSCDGAQERPCRPSAASGRQSRRSIKDLD
ncbi:MAG TPA: MarR family transcriptional regulator [Terracidiphilus sp.]|nr:MarR family transcriptional regulator [Terracidiphilus sp.]